MRGLIAAALTLGLLTTGCLASIREEEHSAVTESTENGPLVVALLDTGANPYLPIFAVPDDSFVKSAAPENASKIVLSTQGELLERAEADEAIWESFEPHVLYHYAGTRLLGISFDHDRVTHYNRDSQAHGTATSYLAAREAPDAIIVMIQVGARYCEDPTKCLIDPSVAEAMEWAAAQEWIDVISVSIAIPGNLPNHPAAQPEMMRYLRATEAAARNGKLIVNGAGNEPTPSIADYFNGPPWIIVVGGVESEARGEHVVTSRLVDVVANFSDYAPMFLQGEMGWRQGTSYATPIVAGTLANAWGRIRAAEPTRDVTTQELRDALNASAIHFNTTEWDPTPPGRDPLPWDLTYASLPILVQPQMGWGYVDASFAPEIARRVLEADLKPPAHKQQAIAFQAQWQNAREEYWATQP